MHVGAEAGNLHLAQHLRVLGIPNVDHHKRVDPLERDHVGHVIHEACRPDRLPRLAKIRRLTDHHQLVALRAQRPEPVVGGKVIGLLVPALPDSRHAHHAVALIHGELVENPAIHETRGLVRKPDVHQVKRMQDGPLSPVAAPVDMLVRVRDQQGRGVAIHLRCVAQDHGASQPRIRCQHVDFND